MDAKLVVVGGEARTNEYTLTLPTVIGRSRSADLNLGNPLVSRQHCEIYEADGVLMVRDLGSLNGTFVGDTRITEEAMLEPGDLLTVGATTFRAVYESSYAGGETMAAAGDEPEFGLPSDPEDTPSSPHEIQQTLQADGLAALEELRPAHEEAADLPGGDFASSDDDLDFGWFEEATDEDEGIATLPEAPEEAALDAGPPNTPEIVIDELELVDDLEMVDDVETIPVEPENVAKPPAKASTKPTEKIPSPKPTEKNSTQSAEKNATKSADKNASPKPADEAAKVEHPDEELDEFFKNLG